MPQKSGFFDTTADDPREYPAREFAEYFGRLLTNGVFNAGAFLNVTASGTDANVSLSPGAAWIKGYAYSVYDSPLILPIQPATTQDRIDRVILRLDTSTAVRAIRALVVQGVAAANPSPPALIRSGDVYDLSLAQIRVRANSTIVQQANITDERLNTSVCGLVNSLITVDTTTFQQQWDAFIASIQSSGFATPAYVDSKAAAAETNAKNASLPRTGGTVSGPLTLSSTLRVNGEVTFADGGTYSSLKQSVVDGKGSIETIINQKGGTVSKAESVATFPELVNGVNTIQQGVYANQTITLNSGLQETYPISPSHLGIIGPTLCTFAKGTKIFTAIGQSYSSITSDIEWNASFNTDSIWAQLCLYDNAGVQWNLMKSGSSNFVISNSTRYITALNVDIQGGKSSILFGGLNESVSNLPRMETSAPANFDKSGPFTLRYAVTLTSSSVNMSFICRTKNINFISM